MDPAAAAAAEEPLVPARRSLCGSSCDRDVCGLASDAGRAYCVDCLRIALAATPAVAVKLTELRPRFCDIVWEGITAADICHANRGPHWRAITAADTRSPIIAVRASDATGGGERLEVLDGLHRICRAHVERELSILCKVAAPEQLALCAVGTAGNGTANTAAVSTAFSPLLLVRRAAAAARGCARRDSGAGCWRTLGTVLTAGIFAAILIFVLSMVALGK